MEIFEERSLCLDGFKTRAVAIARTYRGYSSVFDLTERCLFFVFFYMTSLKKVNFSASNRSFPFYVEYTWTRTGCHIIYFHVFMSYVLQYSRHKPTWPDISSPRDKTSDTMVTEASRSVCLMLHSNLCIMQVGQLRDFVTV
jgi:hypothetical protein